MQLLIIASIGVVKLNFTTTTCSTHYHHYCFSRDGLWSWWTLRDSSAVRVAIGLHACFNDKYCLSNFSFTQNEPTFENYPLTWIWRLYVVSWHSLLRTRPPKQSFNRSNIISSSHFSFFFHHDTAYRTTLPPRKNETNTIESESSSSLISRRGKRTAMTRPIHHFIRVFIGHYSPFPDLSSSYRWCCRQFLIIVLLIVQCKCQDFAIWRSCQSLISIAN